jgi:hypothetical protein
MLCVYEKPALPPHLVQDAFGITLQELEELPPLRHLHSNTYTWWLLTSVLDYASTTDPSKHACTHALPVPMHTKVTDMLDGCRPYVRHRQTFTNSRNRLSVIRELVGSL